MKADWTQWTEMWNKAENTQIGKCEEHLVTLVSLSPGAVLPARATAHISALNSSSSSSSNSLYLYVSCGGTQTLHKTHAQYMPLESETSVTYLASTCSYSNTPQNPLLAQLCARLLSALR